NYVYLQIAISLASVMLLKAVSPPSIPFKIHAIILHPRALMRIPTIRHFLGVATPPCLPNAPAPLVAAKASLHIASFNYIMAWRDNFLDNNSVTMVPICAFAAIIGVERSLGFTCDGGA
ncbi:MAG: hypothetical protein ACOYMG_18765, partial [Candidatus Methylumidiphilus sp.]